MKKIHLIAAMLACALSLSAQEWGQVNISVANIRSEKGNSSELSSQELMGMPVKLLKPDGEWWQVETADGYHGWLRDESIVHRTADELDQWRQSPRLIVTSLGQIKAYTTSTASGPRQVVTDLVPCDIVEGSLHTIDNGRVCVMLPDGRVCWADADAFTPIEAWAAQEFDPDVILDQAHSMIGSPYLWGGTSAKALDCSGLSKTSYLANGIILLRDASMQARTGKQLPTADWHAYEPCDLLFFGNHATGRVTHVAIYDADGRFVHSTGRGDRVRTNSLDPDSPEAYDLKVLKAVRIHGSEGTEGITRAIDHPWLFNK